MAGAAVCHPWVLAANSVLCAYMHPTIHTPIRFDLGNIGSVAGLDESKKRAHQTDMCCVAHRHNNTAYMWHVYVQLTVFFVKVTKRVLTCGIYMSNSLFCSPCTTMLQYMCPTHSCFWIWISASDHRGLFSLVKCVLRIMSSQSVPRDDTAIYQYIMHMYIFSCIHPSAIYQSIMHMYIFSCVRMYILRSMWMFICKSYVHDVCERAYIHMYGIPACICIMCMCCCVIAYVCPFTKPCESSDMHDAPVALLSLILKHRLFFCTSFYFSVLCFIFLHIAHFSCLCYLRVHDCV